MTATQLKQAGDRTANYSYRSTTEQTLINVKTSIQKAVRAVKNTLRHYELIARPEVRIRRNLPELPAPERWNTE